MNNTYQSALAHMYETENSAVAEMLDMLILTRMGRLSESTFQ